MLINATKEQQELIEVLQKTLLEQQKLIDKVLLENSELANRLKAIQSSIGFLKK